MTQSVHSELIVAIHHSGRRCVLAITGGGSGAISQLLAVPGASRTVMEAVVPYAGAALDDWIGGEVEQHCSPSTARAMAMASWMRAKKLSTDADPRCLIGIGATASLASDRPKRGDHRVHVAAQTATCTVSYSLVLAKGHRERPDEEALAAQLILLALAKAANVEPSTARSEFDSQLHNGEQVETINQLAEPAWTELLLGERQFISYPDSADYRAIFPGAFNPPHAGHRHIAALAAKRLQCPVAYELSITNVDKPPLDFVEINTRLTALRAADPNAAVVLTAAPTFRAKAALFPGCTFVVGADTMARIAEPKYYHGQPAEFTAAIEKLAEHGCRFLVFGREIEGRFRTLSDLTLPPALHQLCDEVTAAEFRENISSTQLRATK